MDYGLWICYNKYPGLLGFKQYAETNWAEKA